MAQAAMGFIPLLLALALQPSAALVGPQLLRRPAAPGYSTSFSTSFSTPTLRSRVHPLRATDQPSGPVLNTGMVRKILFNQILLGYSIWLTNGDGRELLSATHFDPVSLGVGVVGGAAVVAAERYIEKSPNPLFAELNLSTNMLVLRLFGARPQPLVAGTVSLGLAALVAVSEETIFRGVITSRLAENIGTLPGAGCGVLLFALGHINPLALGKETLILFALQLFTSASFTVLLFATHGLAAPIVAHCLYDWYTFYETHLAVTGQMAFADEEGGSDDLLLREFRFIDKNRDGSTSADELRIALFARGIKTDNATAQQTFAAADTDSSGDVSFEEFVKFVEEGEGEGSEAFKRGLLGVA